jgi:hypothetical protein
MNICVRLKNLYTTKAPPPQLAHRNDACIMATGGTTSTVDPARARPRLSAHLLPVRLRSTASGCRQPALGAAKLSHYFARASSFRNGNAARILCNTAHREKIFHTLRRKFSSEGSGARRPYGRSARVQQSSRAPYRSAALLIVRVPAQDVNGRAFL